MKRFIFTRVWRIAPLVLAATSVGLFFILSAGAQTEGPGEVEGSRIRIGYQRAPVPLRLEELNPAQVGLGAYYLNAQIGCTDCHTWPNYAPGGNPFLGQPEQINTARYLAGGRSFPGGIVSRNITPDPVTGLPAGLTLDALEREPGLPPGITDVAFEDGTFPTPPANSSAVVMKKGIGTVPTETMDALTRYDWPGNIRELQNLIERAAGTSPKHNVNGGPHAGSGRRALAILSGGVEPCRDN